MIYPEQYQNNTRITPERVTLLMISIFTWLFEGETYSRVEFYYNRI
jgi:hypothetical protein